MKKPFALLLIGSTLLSSVILSCSSKRNTSVPAIYSENVKDSFELYIDLPAGYHPDSNIYSVAYYMDANLKMGKEIRRQIRLEGNQKNLENVIFVGIGHIGNYRKRRRRDFIPPVMKNGTIKESNDPDFGHADIFYQFLTKELIPYINEQYPNNGNYTYIGHSFSGLFAFYCLFQPQPVFKNYVALSPSLWANYNNFYEYEKDFSSRQKTLNATLYHACGTAEWSNKVLSTSRDMSRILDDREYPGLNYTFVEHPGKNHNGVVPVSLGYLLKNLKF